VVDADAALTEKQPRGSLRAGILCGKTAEKRRKCSSFAKNTTWHSLWHSLHRRGILFGILCTGEGAHLRRAKNANGRKECQLEMQRMPQRIPLGIL
jgi:hypothetical protein